MSHYRFALDGIERMQLGKLLMIQDKNLLAKYRDKRLEDIEFEGECLGVWNKIIQLDNKIFLKYLAKLCYIYFVSSTILPTSMKEK